ncbi:AraC family transcriptional regulator [Paenibacillus sp. MER TA 81-3]|uniref:helix-turn-helix domain-containing protein n=1 Tax=Paenibacillus sp. MER TA 81-3 TaxID=2939573 RepID=UPI00203AEF00|nr:helix-turn-helix domain-containing protein [Paenibacillus sp. MER TA 81-3]MCM3339846.1 AraC family transcriptional regulator [Paenibacillus sp. MER TA 81-3]
MNYIDIVNDAIEYIETNLFQGVQLEELSDRYYMSHTHFYRIFRAVASRTLKEYIDMRRLSVAAEKIKRSSCKMVDIAFECGFQSHESFSRAFKRAFGLSPTEYRHGMREIRLLPRQEIVERDFKNVNRDLIVSYDQVELDDRTVVGRNISFDPEHPHEIARATSFIQAFVEREVTPFGVPRLYSITTCSKTSPTQIDYTCAIDPAARSLLSGYGLVSMNIPASKYAVFRYRGSMGHIFHTVHHDLYKCIAISGLCFHSVGIDFFERYEQDYASTGAFSIYVPIT